MCNSKKLVQDVCRLCLSSNFRLYSIENVHLQDVYEKLTEVKLSSINTVQTVCYICTTKLKQCYILQERAVLSNKLLQEAFEYGRELKPTQHHYNLAKSSTINISLDPIEFDIKDEAQIKKELSRVNEEIDENTSQIDTQEDVKSLTNLDVIKLDDANISDSEDDLPLMNISLKQNKLENNHTKVEKTRKYNRQTKVDAQEVLLDEEQQISEMVERSKSVNYVNSPYKCCLCYRGFIDPVAFERHKEKHDEVPRFEDEVEHSLLGGKAPDISVPFIDFSENNAKISGPYKCALCHLRYATSKRLNAHVASAHSRRYLCNLCPHNSRTKHQAKSHEKWHNGHTYPCKPCGRVFTKPTSLLSHLRKCVSEACTGVERSCRECGETFARRHGLLMHLSKAHRHHKQELPLEPEALRHCGDCNILFASVSAKTRHVLTSRRHNVFNDELICTICNTKVSPTTRDSHLRTHTRSLRTTPAVPIPNMHVQCDQCKASFSNRSRLQNHVKRMHLGLKYNKNIVCEICGKKCTSGATLRYHQRRHTGERPFPCTTCGKSFPTAERLRAHTRTHSGERPYQCDHCHKRFTQRPALTRHYRVHTGAKPYSCHICSKRFSQSPSLRTHIRAVHLRLARDTQKHE